VQKKESEKLKEEMEKPAIKACFPGRSKPVGISNSTSKYK
jgi:hypothetical protein